MTGWGRWLGTGLLALALLPVSASAADLVVAVESFEIRGKGKLALHCNNPVVFAKTDFARIRVRMR